MAVKISPEERTGLLDGLWSHLSPYSQTGSRIYLYFIASYNVGRAELFVNDAQGQVRKVKTDPDPENVLIKDWMKRQQAERLTYQQWLDRNTFIPGGWTWGWAEFSNTGKGELHLFDNPMSDDDLVGPDHSTKWRKERFGDTKIDYSTFDFQA